MRDILLRGLQLWQLSVLLGLYIENMDYTVYSMCFFVSSLYIHPRDMMLIVMSFIFM